MTPEGRSDEALSERAPGPVWFCFSVCMLAFVAIGVVVILQTSRFWYDETWYLATVDAFRRQGFSIAFLRDLPGPAGPLYTWVHYLLAPITGLRPLATRLATMAMFLLTVLVLAGAARAGGVRYATLRAPQLLGAPMLYGSIGTALTEVPALLAFVAHVALLLVAVRASRRNRALAIGLGVLSGLCCGFAIAGRQTFLPVLLALPVLGLHNRPARWPLAACALVSLILPGFVFAAWGGLTPPTITFVGRGISIANVFTAFAYAGLVYVVFDASWLAGRVRFYGAVILAGLLCNLALGLFSHAPLIATAARWLSPAGANLYARVCGGLFFGWGLVFMVMLLARLRERSTLTRYLTLGSMLIIGSALKVTIPYGGRYVAGSLPFLLMLGLRRSDTKWKAMRLAIAAAVGLVSLNSYIMYSLK